MSMGVVRRLLRWVLPAGRRRPVCARTVVVGVASLLLALALIAAPTAPEARGDTPTASSLAPISCGDGVRLERPKLSHRYNPLTATDAQLHAMDFPPRPSTPAALAVWRTYAARYQAGQVDQGSSCGLKKVARHTHPPMPAGQATVTPSLVPADGHGYTSNWAGNVDHNALYTDAEAQWVVPGAVGPIGYRAYSNAWVGVSLGGTLENPDYTHPIVQAGSESDFFGSSAQLPFAWFEVWPQIQTEQLTDLVGIAGHLLFVHVAFTTDGHMGFHIVDESRGIDRRYSKYYPGTRPDGHAEFIVERPTVGGILPALANFRRVRFQSAQSAAPTTGWRGVGNLAHYYLTMVGSTGHVLANPGPIDSTGYIFNDDWYNFA
jgi:hypothetical protein